MRIRAAVAHAASARGAPSESRLRTFGRRPDAPLEAGRDRKLGSVMRGAWTLN